MCVDLDRTLISKMAIRTIGSYPGLILEVVNRLNGVHASNSGVSKAEQKFLIVFISVSQVLAYQEEVRLDTPVNIKLLVSGFLSFSRLKVLHSGSVVFISHFYSRDVCSTIPGCGDVGGDAPTGGGGHRQVLELHLVHPDIPVIVQSFPPEIFSPEPWKVDFGNSRDSPHLPVSVLVVDYQKIEASVLVDPSQLVCSCSVFRLVHFGRDNLDRKIIDI